MVDNFKPEETAAALRNAALNEIHDDSAHGALLDKYATLDRNQLNSVAKALEADNSFLSTAPRAEVHRENGEVSGVTFTSGHLDFGLNEHRLDLINGSDRVLFAKSADGTTILTGKKTLDADGSGDSNEKTQFLGPEIYKETPSVGQETFDKVARAMVGAAIGRKLSLSIEPTALASAPKISPEGWVKSSWLKGVVVGGGIEAAEEQLYDRLKDNHKFIANIIKPSAIEATIVGAAAAAGASNMKIGLGLIAGGVIVGKLANAAVNEFKELAKE